MKKRFFCYIVVLLYCFVRALPVEAQGLKSAGSLFQQVGGDAGANTYSQPQQLIGTGINAALTLVGLIFLILMIYAGYLWLTARGEEEPINKAKKIITSSIVGFVLVASAYAITVFVGKRFEQGGSGTVGDTASSTGANTGDPSKDVCCQICEKTSSWSFSGCDYEPEPNYKFVKETSCSAIQNSCVSSGDCTAKSMELGEFENFAGNCSEPFSEQDCNEIYTGDAECGQGE